MDKQTLIIVGGGISGLVAARQLSQYYEITLLEAMLHFGGRIRTVTAENFPAAIEGGAEFVHGEASETIKLLNEAGIPFVKVEGEIYHKKGNSLVVGEDENDGLDILMEKMGSLAEDMTLQHLLSTYFNGSEFEGLRKRAITFAQGFDLADENKVSIKALYEEWSAQSEDSRIEGGYGSLIRFLVNDCEKKGVRLFNNTAVKEISWKEGSVALLAGDQKIYKADRCLLTVSLGVLKSNSLTFNPPIADYVTAAGRIGFGTVVKIILAFKERFWDDNASFFFSEEVIPVWWPQSAGNGPVLSGWSGGPNGAELSVYTDEQVLQKALTSLAAIFSTDIEILKEKLTGAEIFNWKNNPSVLGAYSYAMPESSEALKLLNTPIDQTLYFAGEGLYSGSHPGTVEAAIVNVQQMAKQLRVQSAG
jgi:monoamine oxidase